MRRFFSGLAAVSVLLAVLTFLVLYKHLIDIPEKYEAAVITAVPVLVLIAVISLFISSSLRRRETISDDCPTGEILVVRIAENGQNSLRNDVYAVNQLNILRGKLAGILGRIVVSALITILLVRDIPVMFIPIYLVVSYSWIFIKATRNYLIGIIAFIVVMYGTLSWIDELSRNTQTILLAVLILGVFVIDIINIIRYIRLRAQMR